jgi:hypothetical protein
MSQMNIQPETLAREFAKGVCIQFFENKDRAEGHDLLKLSPSLQVNLWVVYQVSQQWAIEMDKIKSPYFDFEKQQVKEAFTTFRNLVSRHISIKREVLEPLLVQETLRYINWVLHPGELENIAPGLRNAELKYLKTYTQSIEKWQNEEIWEQPTEQEKYLALKRLSDEMQQILPQFNSMAEPTSEQPSKAEIPSEKKPARPKSINESLAVKKSLTENLTLNQKLMFQSKLFGGNQEEMNKALNTAEGLENFDKALDFLKTRFAGRYKWDFETEEVTELLELLEHYFSK